MTRRKRFRLLRSSILAASVWAVPVNAQYVVGAGYVSGSAPQVTHSLLVSSSDAADPTGLTGGRALLAAVAASKISGQSIQLVPDSVGGFFNLGGTANPSVTVTNNLVLPDGVSLNGNWPVTLGIGGTATIIPISSMSESGTLGTLTLTSAATFTSTQEAIVWSALNTATFLQTGFNGIWPVTVVSGTGGTVCTYPLNVSGLSADTTSTAACLILNNGGCIIGNSNGSTATMGVSTKVGSIVATGNNCQVSNLSIVGTMLYGMSSFPLGEIL